MSPLKKPQLLSSPNGERFLHQFDAAERNVAVTLAESLVLVSHDEYIAGLKSELVSLISESKRATALFAVREVEDGDYFDLSDKTKRPSAIAPGAKVGSEGSTATLIRDICRMTNPSSVLDHPSLESMRSTKTRRIIVVDDIIGSGRRMLKFLNWLQNNPTIRSWLSYGLIRFYPVVFGLSEIGKREVVNHPAVGAIRSSRLLTRGSITWNRQEFRTYESLCFKYGARTSRPFWSLGFADAMTMMVFQHKCPNTTPAIFWAGSKSWYALFRVRPEFEFPEWPEAQEEESRTQMVLRSLGQTQLSEMHWQKYVSVDARHRFLLLAVLAKRRMDLDYICAAINTTIEKCRKLVKDCIAYGWITTGFRVTSAGLAELARAKELRLLTDETPILTDNIYVPQSFRGSSA